MPLCGFCQHPHKLWYPNRLLHCRQESIFMLGKYIPGYYIWASGSTGCLYGVARNIFIKREKALLPVVLVIWQLNSASSCRIPTKIQTKNPFQRFSTLFTIEGGLRPEFWKIALSNLFRINLNNCHLSPSEPDSSDISCLELASNQMIPLPIILFDVTKLKHASAISFRLLHRLLQLLVDRGIGL